MIEPKICILSGLEIPYGQESIEHFVPKHRAPKRIWNDPRNRFYAQYMLNAVKGDKLGCEWENIKYALTYQAIKKWNLKSADREFLERAMQNWSEYRLNPCSICLMKCKER